MFNTVVPETARNNERSRNRNENQSKGLDNSTKDIRYEKIAVYNKSIVCFALISSP
jgi:hypothetical protein